MKIIINFRRCRLQLDNFFKKNYVKKNWLNDPRIGCKHIFNLLELIKIDIKLKELVEFERTFKRDEILEM